MVTIDTIEMYQLVENDVASASNIQIQYVLHLLTDNVGWTDATDQRSNLELG